ncbi:hypothetical protein AC1031_018298 [Aphanomyces cochlioides]|nr:hypothetical protein AC1031_018298 [Aphanomyces cochlioides]
MARRKAVTSGRSCAPRGQLVPFTGTFVCNSVAFIDKPDLEIGDKVILPSKALLEIQCLKIPLPLLFKLTSPTLPTLCQYCSVMEFSAPDGQVACNVVLIPKARTKMYAPYWMMDALGVDEGGQIHIESVLAIPKGIYCQFQPDELEFLDVAAQFGPKALLESTMRRYSCLSLDSFVTMEYGDQRYKLKVVDVKPASVVHLFGDVDLEVDFKMPEKTDPRRPNSAIRRNPSGEVTQSTRVSPRKLAAPFVSMSRFLLTEMYRSAMSTSFGRRLADGGFVQSTIDNNATSAASTRKHDKQSLHQAQAKAFKPREALDPFKFKGVRAFATTGFSLVDNQTCKQPATNIPLEVASKESTREETTTPLPTESTCTYCLAEIPVTNAELHALRCKQNVAYHRYCCPVCHEKILRLQEQRHVHYTKCSFIGTSEAVTLHNAATHAEVRCECGERLSTDALAAHKESKCRLTMIPCGLCSLTFKREKFDAHYTTCSNRTQQCEVCTKYINVVAFDKHVETCVTKSSPSKSKADQADAVFACPYCSRTTFATMEALTKHTDTACPIARRFHNQETPILRGKLRRKGDLVKPKTLQKAGERIAQAKELPSNQTIESFGPQVVRPLRGSSVPAQESKQSRQKQVDAILPSSRSQHKPTKRL